MLGHLVGTLTTSRQDNLPRQSRGLLLLKFGLLAAMAGLSTAAGHAVEEGTTPVGLQGLLSEVPADLTPESYTVSNEEWNEFAQKTAEEVAEFYRLEGDVAAQRAALDKLKARRDAVQKGTLQATTTEARVTLLGLYGPLARRIDFADAVLATLELDPDASQKARVRDAVANVRRGRDQLAASLRRLKGGEKWLDYVKAPALIEALESDPTGEAAVTAAKATAEKLAGRNTLAEDKATSKKFLSRKSFVDFEKDVLGYIAAAEAPTGENSVTALRESLGRLLTALEQYEASATNESAATVRETFRELQRTAPDGGALVSAAMRKHFFNYNFRAAASEQFLSKLMSEARVEQGQVVDNILGANVGGSQTTSTRVGVNLKPASNRIRFDITLNGVVQSSTAGVTSQATVYTSGYHTFAASKEVTFDGFRFATAPAGISVNANNTTTGIATRYSGGLFGGIADRVASREVASREGASEAIAASRVQSRIAPRFNQEVDNSFARAERKLNNETYAGLRAVNLYPQSLSVSSTDTELRVRSRLMNRDQLGASITPSALLAGKGLKVALHESALNNSLDELGLAGQTLTDAEVRAKLEDFLSKALGRPVSFAAPPPSPAPAPAADEGTAGDEAEGEEDDEARGPSAFVFAEKDPARISVGTDTLTLILRTGFKQDNGDEIPTQEIRVPLSFRVNKSKVVVTRGNIVVAGEGNLATRGVIRRKIQQSLPERELTSRVKLKGPDRTVSAWVREIKLVDGWVGLRIN